MAGEVDAIGEGDVKLLFDSFELTEARLIWGEKPARQKASQFPLVKVITRPREETAFGLLLPVYSARGRTLSG